MAFDEKDKYDVLDDSSTLNNEILDNQNSLEGDFEDSNMNYNQTSVSYIGDNENLDTNHVEQMNYLVYEFHRKDAYSKVSKSSLLFLLYTLLFGIVFSFLNDAGLHNLFTVSASLLMIYFYIGKRKKKQILTIYKKMRFMDLIFFVGLMYAINYLFSFLTTFIVDIIGLPSVDVTTEIALSSNPILLVYAILIGPLFEEIQYRGFYLNHIRKYGIQAAILISTITFCFAHLNIIQSIGTLGIGLVISYVSYVYSFKMGLIIHIINNIIAFGLTYLLGADENSLIAIIIGSVILVLIVYSIIRLIFKKQYKELFEQLKYKENEKENFHAVFKNGWFIAYTIIALILSIVSGF